MEDINKEELLTSLNQRLYEYELLTRELVEERLEALDVNNGNQDVYEISIRMQMISHTTMELETIVAMVEQF